MTEANSAPSTAAWVRGADVVVVGAGVTGNSVAYHLAREGAEVLVVERDDLAAGSSGSCDGYVFMQTKAPGPHLSLAMESTAAYDRLSDELGYDIQFRRCGGFIVIRTAPEWEVMKRLVDRQRAAGLPIELLDASQVRRMEPFLDGQFEGAAYCPIDGKIDPIHLALGFAQGAQRYGARFLLHTPAESVVLEGGRATGIQTPSGRISCNTLVVACGVWTPWLLQGLGLTVPIKPRRGQVLVTEPLPPVLNHTMLDARYIAVKFNPKLVGNGDDPISRIGISFALEQTAAGNLLIGNTREFVGYDRRTTLEALQAIRHYASGIARRLERVPIIRTFAGLRPYTPDGLPLLGPVEDIPGLILAAGHEGDGIALAAITGKLVSQLVREGAVPPLMEPCLPRRFPLVPASSGAAQPEDTRPEGRAPDGPPAEQVGHAKADKGRKEGGRANVTEEDARSNHRSSRADFPDFPGDPGGRVCFHLRPTREGTGGQ